MTARGMDRKASELMRPVMPAAVVNGEVVVPSTVPSVQRAAVRDTLAGGQTVAKEASIARTDLLLQSSTDIVALAVDAAHTMGAANSIEKMLAHQMTLAHALAFRVGDKAMRLAEKRDLHPAESVELARLSNTVARLMSAFQVGCETVQRLRTGGGQTVTVRHVNVSPGGQAVIGNISPPGGASGEESR